MPNPWLRNHWLLHASQNCVRSSDEVFYRTLTCFGGYWVCHQCRTRAPSANPPTHGKCHCCSRDSHRSPAGRRSSGIPHKWRNVHGAAAQRYDTARRFRLQLNDTGQVVWRGRNRGIADQGRCQHLMASSGLSVRQIRIYFHHLSDGFRKVCLAQHCGDNWHGLGFSRRHKHRGCSRNVPGGLRRCLRDNQAR